MGLIVKTEYAINQLRRTDYEYTNILQKIKESRIRPDRLRIKEAKNEIRRYTLNNSLISSDYIFRNLVIFGEDRRLKWQKQ